MGWASPLSSWENEIVGGLLGGLSVSIGIQIVALACASLLGKLGALHHLVLPAYGLRSGRLRSVDDLDLY